MVRPPGAGLRRPPGPVRNVPAWPGAEADAGREPLDAVLADVVRQTRASVGLVYVLPPGETVLRLVLVYGVTRQIAAPWARVPLAAKIPVSEAIREDRLVWLGSQEETARLFPRLGIVLPYDFMLAAEPFSDGGPVQGGIVLLWPAWHPPQLGADERAALTAGCRRAGRLLRHAADSGGPLPVTEEPRVLTPAQVSPSDPAQAMAALAFAERLPLGCCALDPEGRITFLNPAAADLLGHGAAELLGRRPWEALAWLHDPVFEDRYREAVVTSSPTGFTTLRSPGNRLEFRLYPDEHGISVHITPVTAPQSPSHPHPHPGPDPHPKPPPVSGEPVGATALYHLTHLAVALAEAVGVKDVAELVADQLVPAFGPQGLALLTMEEGRLRVVAHRGYSAEFVHRFDGTPLTAHTPHLRALTTGAPVFYATYADFQSDYPSAPRYADRSAYAFLPLTAAGNMVGSLVLSYDRPRAFHPAERALLTSLAGLIAQALDRARLYDAKHDLAHTLQTALLPQVLPSVPGLEVAARYLPAAHGMDIGGDFYDLIHPTPTTAVAAIGDVQGHNLKAATLMGQIRTAVHAHATAGTPPDAVLARTNRLLADLDPGLFTSCLIARIDLTRQCAHIATAGHPPPLLRHPDGRAETLTVPPGLLLGIDPDADYPTTLVALPPGAVLVLYTDGLVETPGADIGQSTNALARHLARAESQDLDVLADSLIGYAQHTANRTDDIALLLIRPQPASAHPAPRR